MNQRPTSCCKLSLERLLNLPSGEQRERGTTETAAKNAVRLGLACIAAQALVTQVRWPTSNLRMLWQLLCAEIQVVEMYWPTAQSIWRFSDQNVRSPLHAVTPAMMAMGDAM
jgi:hypothetical protein